MMSEPVVDPAFIGVSKRPGLTLWRIENKEVVKQAAVSHHLQMIVLRNHIRLSAIEGRDSA